MKKYRAYARYMGNDKDYPDFEQFINAESEDEVYEQVDFDLSSFYSELQIQEVPTYTVVAYKPNGVDSCMSCVVDQWSSNFDLIECDTLVEAINKMANIIFQSYFEKGYYDIFLLENGIKIDDNDCWQHQHFQQANEKAKQLIEQENNRKKEEIRKQQEKEQESLQKKEIQKLKELKNKYPDA